MHRRDHARTEIAQLLASLVLAAIATLFVVLAMWRVEGATLA